MNLTDNKQSTHKTYCFTSEKVRKKFQLLKKFPIKVVKCNVHKINFYKQVKKQQTNWQTDGRNIYFYLLTNFSLLQKQKLSFSFFEINIFILCFFFLLFYVHFNFNWRYIINIYWTKILHVWKIDYDLHGIISKNKRIRNNCNYEFYKILSH